MSKESKELIDNKPLNFVIFSHKDQSIEPLYGHTEYPIFERGDKTDRSSGIIRTSIMVNPSSENSSSSLCISVWEDWKGTVHYANHIWKVKGVKGKFTRRGFGSDGKDYTRNICKGVYFNQDITELHFPEGIVRLK